ncbi:toll/interleukin-1 receptor domain-containing protein [Agrobacterium tumefaciens]|uniref:toll/interleukin-1 receptor domain-containing protein n=1 Tax=Agrobacterium tumefaciens TaxID=358 RepID=UPI003BA24000
MKKNHEFDVALSFAGEDREYVDKVAHYLKDRGIKVFYDLFEEADLWGKDLFVHLSDIYQKRAQYTVMFISKMYAEKLWTNHERRSAQARAFQDAQEYILPARFDDTEIPGVLSTVGYVGLQNRTPEELASLIVKKIVSSGGSVPTELVRRDFSTIALSPSRGSSDFVVTVRDDEGSAILGCQITLQADNGTFVDAETDDNGIARFQLAVRRPSILLASHSMFPAVFYENLDPDGGMTVTLPRTDNIGSVTMASTGYIPGLKGRLNPILDTSNRTYLYADNIAIAGGVNQPATFKLNEPLELEDADGVIVYMTVKHIASRVSLIQFTRQPKRP